MCAGRRILCSSLFFAFLLFLFLHRKQNPNCKRKSKQNLEKIQEVEKIIGETSTKKKNSLGELSALNQRIRVQEKFDNLHKR